MLMPPLFHEPEPVKPRPKVFSIDPNERKLYSSFLVPTAYIAGEFVSGSIVLNEIQRSPAYPGTPEADRIDYIDIIKIIEKKTEPEKERKGQQPQKK